MTNNRLIVLTRCRNEERQLADFLDMCGSISEGVLFLDDHSTDNSLSIAKSHPAVLKAWKSFQRTEGCMGEGCDYVALLTIAKAYDPDWILILDADERIDPSQFILHKDKIFSSGYNSVALMWPYCDETNNKAVFWGYGPQFNKNQVKIPFKRNILMKFEDVDPIYAFRNNKPTQHVKPHCKNQNSGWCNIVLKHLCVRPASERIEKWERRLPLEEESMLGYDKNILVDHMESLRNLPPEQPTYDKWINSMMKEYGSECVLNTRDFYLEDNPSWNMLFSHLPMLRDQFGEGKQLIW
jgi:glycosyltransferase involved in cell wall biosynthesis